MAPKKRTSRRPVRQPRQGPLPAESRAALRMMRGLRGPNDKYIQTTLTAGVNSSPTLTSPVIVCLNAVAQGTSENTRIGRLAKMKWIDLNLSLSGAYYAEASRVRFYLIVETSTLGSALAPSQFLLDSTNFDPLSQRDRTNRDASRFCVIYDSKTHVIGGELAPSGVTAPAVLGGGQPNERVWTLHLPLNFATDYSRGNAGTVADIDTNALTLLILTDNVNGSHVLTQATWTIAFNDDS